MQDVIVALYDQHSSAVDVRTELVKDGFATDRVELTSPYEHLQADKGPSGVFEANVADYFRTLAADEEGARQLKEIAQAVVQGASAITLHPRGNEELKRAETILRRHSPRQVYRYLPEDAGHALDRQMERAAGSPNPAGRS